MPAWPRGAGLGWRQEIGADLLARPAAVDFIEIVAETCFHPGPLQRQALALAELWPVVPHGVKLSLGSADGIEPQRARRLGDLARALRAPLITEHVAFTRSGRSEIGHLTALPYSRAAVAVVARNVAAARRHLPDVPLVLENAAWTVRWPESEMDEGTFYHEIVRATGCPLLLDLGNLYAHARNSGLDPLAVLRSYPLGAVAMVHLAGGHTDEEDGFYFDSHAHPVPAAVFELLAETLRVAGPVPVLIERDANFPPCPALLAEVQTARDLLAAAGAPAPAPTPARPMTADPPAAAADAAAQLGAAQATLTALLTEPRELAFKEDRPHRFAARDIARSREVLLHKRVDDALPLLPRLSARADLIRDLALACVRSAQRPPRDAAIADARRIAAAAAGLPGPVAALAAQDLLVLRCRFAGPGKDGTMQPRLLPSLSRACLPDGKTLWALKGPGTQAQVHLLLTRTPGRPDDPNRDRRATVPPAGEDPAAPR